jgi:hypothetical protein
MKISVIQVHAKEKNGSMDFHGWGLLPEEERVVPSFSSVESGGSGRLAGGPNSVKVKSK